MKPAHTLGGSVNSGAAAQDDPLTRGTEPRGMRVSRGPWRSRQSRFSPGRAGCGQEREVPEFVGQEVCALAPTVTEEPER